MYLPSTLPAILFAIKNAKRRERGFWENELDRNSNDKTVRDAIAHCNGAIWLLTDLIANLEGRGEFHGIYV